MGRGVFRLPNRGTLSVSDNRLFPVANMLRRRMKYYQVGTSAPGVTDPIRIRLQSGLRPDGYRLIVDAHGICLSAASESAAYHGAQTVLQIVDQARDHRLPRLAIDDWPDFSRRGVYYDVCRGRVPRLDRLMEQVDLLSRFKINEFQLYIEHTFRFRGHPDIGRQASPLTAEDILTLDTFCRERYIELVPSLASFGHLATVLKHPQYHHLAEDWGIGKYVCPKDRQPKMTHRHRGWSLSPANPKIYDFLDSLFAEFLPLFRSERFNVCCDEVHDLGCGQSYALCRKKGKGRVYLEHIRKIRDLAAKYGKRIMFWGDIIRNYPELIPEIPRGVVVLDWGYDSSHPFGRISDFKKVGLPIYACPGTSGWGCLFPRLHEAEKNIHGFAEAGKRNGAEGLLNTDWGDGGHYNFMEYSWHGYLFGAEQAWHVDAVTKDFTARFCKLFLGVESRDLVAAIDELGDLTHLRVSRYYQSIWRWIFYAVPDDPVFEANGDNAWISQNGKLVRKNISLDRAFAEDIVRRLQRIRVVFVRHSKGKGADPHGVLPYWIFALDTMLCAARKLGAFGKGGRDTPAVRKALKRDMTSLMKQFENLWMARNRRSEIRITLGYYRKAIRALQVGGGSKDEGGSRTCRKAGLRQSPAT